MYFKCSPLAMALVGYFGCVQSGWAATVPYTSPGVVNQAQYTFTATGGDVVAYFGGGIAAYDDRIGLIGTTPNISSSSGVLDNQTTKIGNYFNFGSFSGGTVLSFFLNAQQSEQTFYSVNADNPDGLGHIYATNVTAGNLPAGVYVGLEDLSANRGAAPLQVYTADFDYNDTQFVLTGVYLSAVPLPSSAPMFGAALVALGAVGYGLRRKVAVTTA